MRVGVEARVRRGERSPTFATHTDRLPETYSSRLAACTEAASPAPTARPVAAVATPRNPP